MKKISVAGALISGAILGTLAVGSAMAADMPTKAPLLMKAPPPSFSWTGCYLDAGVGYGMWSQDHSTTTDFFTPPVPNITTITTTDGGRGWLGRVGAGCDYQASSTWVIGVFGDYDWTNIKGSMSPLTIGGGFPLVADEKESSEWSVGGRIGYVIAPSVLTYVDGGYTQARFDQMNLMTNLGTLRNSAFPAHTYQGWFIGSGFEYAFTWLPINGLFLRSEYRYSTFQKSDLTEFNVVTLAPSGNSGLGNVLHTSTYVQTVTTSLVWRFNMAH